MTKQTIVTATLTLVFLVGLTIGAVVAVACLAG